jgi:hypothetical protein
MAVPATVDAVGVIYFGSTGVGVYYCALIGYHGAAPTREAATRPSATRPAAVNTVAAKKGKGGRRRRGRKERKRRQLRREEVEGPPLSNVTCILRY